jgi:hypothetical protein
VLSVEAALTVDAVKGAHLAVGWQQVDAKRNAQSAALHRAKDGRWIDDGTHNGVQRYAIKLKIENYGVKICVFGRNVVILQQFRCSTSNR